MANAITSAQVVELDALLEQRGFPSLSPFWVDVVSRFLGSKRRQLVLRVGRRGGKSLSACKLAVAFGIFGAWKVPPGELATIAIVSVSLGEAQSKIKIIRAMLDALGIPIAKSTATEIEVADRPVAFRCMAANMRTAVGFGAVLIIVEEAARLRDDVTGQNPCSEIVASLRPSLATFRGSRLLLISSPLGSSDFHAEQFQRGDTDDQMVAWAPSWIANPTLTEEETRLLEPDPRVHAREFGAIPQAGVLSAFDAADVDRAYAPRGDVLRRHRRVMAIDQSSGSRDLFGFLVAGWADLESGERVLLVDEVGSFRPDEIRELGIEVVIGVLAEKARRAGAFQVFGDQRESMLMRPAFRRAGLVFREMTWTSASKPRAVARLRRWLLEGKLALPPHAQLRREMHVFEERIGPDGQITFGGAHTGDHLAALLTLALADEERLMLGSALTSARSEPSPRAPTRSGPAYQFAGINRPDADPMDRLEERGGSLYVSEPRRVQARSSYVFGRRFGDGFGGF
jgi:hypothetical protein